MKMMGAPDAFPEHTKQAVQKAMEETKQNDGLILNFALNYGSRSEIIDSMKHVLKDVKNGILDEERLK